MSPVRSAPGALLAEVFHPSSLSDRDLQAWAALQAETPEFRNPLLGPDFARAVGEVRADARVAVWRRGGQAVGFLPHHARPGRLARPIGGPFSDYHALVSAAGELSSGAGALRAAGLRAFRFTGLVDPFGLFREGASSAAEGWQIGLEDTGESYLAGLAAGSRNRAKNYRRYHAKLQREVGEPYIVAPAADAGAFDELLKWKRAHIERTGALDFLRPAWTRQLMQRLFDRRDGRFQGLLVSLYAGDRHVCSHFGVRLGEHFHPWIGSSDPDLQACSPGLVHQWMAIEAMSGLGLRTYDLGPGHDHWKRMFASEAVATVAGAVVAASPGGRPPSPFEAVWSLPSAGRLRRRLDQIAVTELTLGGRVHGLVRAVATYDRRLAARAHEPVQDDSAERAAP